MINDTSNSIPNSSALILTHQNSPLKSNDCNISSNIAQAYSQPLSFEKLPIEKIQKIAFTLDAESYANLRLTSRKVKDILPSFQTMSGNLKSGCSGELKKNYESICKSRYEKFIVEQLNNKTDDDTLLAMKNIAVVYSSSFIFGNKDIWISLWNDSLIHKQRDKNILSSCHCRILKNSCEKINTYHSSGSENYYGESKKNLTLGIDHKHINQDNVNIIFKSFNDIFTRNSTRSDDKLIVALISHKLRGFLIDEETNEISENNITEYISQYPALFKAGEIIANHLLTQ